MILSVLMFLQLLMPEAADQDYPLQAVPLSAVEVIDSFWSPRLETNRLVSIPHAFDECAETGRVKNFLLADSVRRGEIPRGDFCTRYGFDDSDVYKVMEGASYTLQTHPDSLLERYLDTLIALVARAQEDDGYLYTMATMRAEHSWAPERWVHARKDGSHELYNLGHLYEAAVAHYRATGKETLLQVALRSAELLTRTFGPTGLQTVPGHQEVELGLIKLYRLTGDRSYLDLAEFFLEGRGRSSQAGDTYNQDHLPVREQTEAVGHAVRAGYQYAAMTDVAVLEDRTDYLNALNHLWADLINHKLYVTGGVGSAGNIEGFSTAYDLPNVSSYCETCAAIALVFWSHRMFLESGQGQYADVMERVLYNGVLAGVSMDGKGFFYVNPLASQSGAQRSPWFTCACCPSNVVRTLPQLPGLVYAHRPGHLYINLFVGGAARIGMAGGGVSVTQRNRYPWDGNLTFAIDPDSIREFALHVRLPSWARGAPVPGDLYHYARSATERMSFRLNQIPVVPEIQDGYAVFNRQWHPGDVLQVDLPMGIRRVVASDAVVDDRGKVALQRGPVVYCLEAGEEGGQGVWEMVLPDTAQLSSEFAPELLGGVQVIRGLGYPVRRVLGGGLTTGEPRAVEAIPYYSWAHRGKRQMEVWVAREVGAAKPHPAPTIAFRSLVSVSSGRGVEALTDQLEPLGAYDRTIPLFSFYPHRGSQEWLQMEFRTTELISRSTFSWCEDASPGGYRLPTQWKFFFRADGQWNEVVTSPFIPGQTVTGVEFAPVSADAARVEIQLERGFSAGLYEWVIE